MKSSRHPVKKGRSKTPGPRTLEKPLRMTVSRVHKPEGLELEEWQRLLRTQYGEQQNFLLENRGDHPVFSEFAVTNPQSGRTYKVAIRGDKPGDNYCSCPDFEINNLGTCKHIAFTIGRLKKDNGTKNVFARSYAPPFSEVFLTYGLKKEVRIRLGRGMPPGFVPLTREFFDGSGRLREGRVLDFPRFLERVPRNNGHEVRCYDDVMAYVAELQDRERRRRVIEDHLKEGADSPVMKKILKTDLYPYQREGALFAVRAGRCLIGDDMGLGKTVQALAAVELMARLFHTERVLIVSPTSLKHQWKGEIEKFTGRKATVIEGLNRERLAAYGDDAFYKLVNYELVWRDMEMIRQWSPDVIILDEAQRIKNWKTRTAQYVKQLESPFAIVLTGTPIENRIEELHSIMEFIDRHHFGPLYRFIHAHRIIDDAGKVVGYRDLESVRRSLEGVMIRRKKNDVLAQLPERVDKNFFVPMTKEQRGIHDENHEIVARLVAKWRRYRFLSEADQRRMQIALSMMRMAADNTYVVDRKTVHGPKIEELAVILREVVIDAEEKVVIFSQWLRMTELVERVLKENGIAYVHLNGSIPSKGRGALMKRFREDPSCMVFLSTDAGGVGLNLQSGSVVINMDIPWNPAVLEQRIGRVHRLGQRRAVRVINFVSKASIEERILDLLKFKKSLFSGALDEGGEDVVMIGESQLKQYIQTVEAATENLESTDLSYEAEDRIEESRDTEAMNRKEAEQEEPAIQSGRASDGEEDHTACAGAPTTAETPDMATPDTDITPEDRGATSPQAKPIAPENSAPVAALGRLIMEGAELLMGMGQALAKDGASPQEAIEKQMQAMMGKDETTGKAYLKVTLPEPEKIQDIFSAIGGLLAGVIAGSRRDR
jgi:superfamily II DNA or RNA helicase